LKRYYVIGSQTPRPISRKSLFTDGSRDAMFRPGIDIDLSHCRPNSTPPAYKADTSAEICMKYLADSCGDDWDLCVIDHIDLDGILSSFTLLHPDIALQHRNVIIGAQLVLRSVVSRVCLGGNAGFVECAGIDVYGRAG